MLHKQRSVIFSLNRSIFLDIHGIRQQINETFLDGSVVYGSDSVRANALRLFDRSGKLKTSAGNLLPFNTEGLHNAPDNSVNYFLAGDVRANENVILTSLQTLLVREHNLWCDAIKQSLPALNGDMTYNIARAMVVAEIQLITYNEYLPLLLGRNALNKYTGYNPCVKPVIFNEFSTAGYRFDHSMVNNILLRLDNNGNVITAGNLHNEKCFFLTLSKSSKTMVLNRC